MELHLKIAGILLISLSFIHVIFPRYFKWKTELDNLSLINRQMMLVHTFFIALTVFLMGLLCLTCAAELTQTGLGNKIVLGLGIFWICRLIIQFVGYSAILWKGKRMETVIHAGLSFLWIYLSAVFCYTYWMYK